jgi:hypothetical protein
MGGEQASDVLIQVKEEQLKALGKVMDPEEREKLRAEILKKYDEEGNTLLAITFKDDVEFSINGIKIGLPESDVKLIK